MPLIQTNGILGPTVSKTGHSAEIELLRKAGIIKAGETIEAHFIEEMQRVGLSVPSVLSSLATLMTGADSDSVKLGAVKQAIQLYMHPAVVNKKDQMDKVMPQITFNIGVPEGAKTQVAMSDILTPRPDKVSETPVIDVEAKQNSGSW